MFYVCRKFSALMEIAAVLKVTCAAQTDAPALKQVKSARANTTDPEHTALIQKINKACCSFLIHTFTTLLSLWKNSRILNHKILQGEQRCF